MNELSPLQLLGYYIDRASFESNRDFDQSKPLVMDGAALVVRFQIVPDKEDELKATVLLTVDYSPAKEVNSPCKASATIVGYFAIDSEFPPEKKGALLGVNGPSILYGIAREVVRNLTSHGPKCEILIPSLSFLKAFNQPSDPPLSPPPAKPVNPTQPASVRPVGDGCDMLGGPLPVQPS